LVEDDPFWQRAISRKIENSARNCRVYIATSAEQAIKMLALDHRYSLIVADHYLEGDKTGYDLWWNCKLRGVNVPFLLTSGNIEFPDEMYKNLPVKFVSKPLVGKELKQNLARLLGQEGVEFFDKSPLSTLAEPQLKFELTAMVAALAMIMLAVYLSSLPAFKIPTNTVEPTLFAPPPPLKIYSPPGRVAKAMRPYPDASTVIGQSIQNAEDVRSVPNLVKEQSNLKLLKDLVFERSE
jgi:CheY-like chemotaxis protein